MTTTAMLDKTALAAFHKELSGHINHDDDAYSAAISAYLSHAAGDVAGLYERLEKRAKEDEECADNNRTVADLLSPELVKFNERGDTGWNTYAVRMAVDHRNSMERDRRYANDLREAATTLLALSARAEAAEARVKEMEAALEPFSRFADALSENVPDAIAIGIYADGAMRFGPSGGANVGSLRAARSLSPIKEAGNV